MRHSRMSSVSRQPLVFHLTGHGTVPSTCCLGPSYPRVKYTLCPSRSTRLWRITSRRLCVNDSSNHPPHLQPPASSSWARRMGGLRPCIDFRTLNSSVLDELQLSNGLLWKAGEETITIIHPAGDKGMNKFLSMT